MDRLEKIVMERYPKESKEEWCWERRMYLEGKREQLRKRLESEQQTTLLREAYKKDEPI